MGKQMSTENKAAINGIFDRVANKEEAKPLEYKVTEIYRHGPNSESDVSELPVTAESIEDVYIFAHHNRRHEKTRIEITQNGKLKGVQNGIGEAWVTPDGLALPHMRAGCI